MFVGGPYIFIFNFFSLAVFGYTPLITWKEFQSCMPWEIAILVGGGFALADGCEVMQFIEDTEQIMCTSSNSDMK